MLFYLSYNEISGYIHSSSTYCLIICARCYTESFVNNELRIQIQAKKQTVKFKAHDQEDLGRTYISHQQSFFFFFKFSRRPGYQFFLQGSCFCYHIYEHFV